MLDRFSALPASMHSAARPILILGMLIGFICLGSCSRIKDKLGRLASAGRTEPAPAAEEPPLTEEEQRINGMLNNPNLFDASATPAPPKATPFELNKSSIVSILGYHDFKERGGEAMVINEAKFREQMKFIKESTIPVVPLTDVLEWKMGRKNVPDECFVITMDDGWEGVYRYAYPVLKEYGFPFTIYLYKKYVNIGGRSLSWAQIQEMMASGLCQIGSHSVSHDSMTSRKGRTDEAYQAYIQSELVESKTFLEQNLRLKINSFAYPYGNYNTLIRDLAHQTGYETLVTVNGSKVTWDTPLGELGRFIIHGVNDSVFRLATSFRGRGPVDSTSIIASSALNDQGRPLVILNPAMHAVVADRRPRLEADLSGLGPILPDSLKMHIAGLGSVQPSYDPATQILRYQIPHRLRRELCDITITLNREGAPLPETIVWQFKIDLAASYVPQIVPAAPDPQPADPEPVSQRSQP